MLKSNEQTLIHLVKTIHINNTGVSYKQLVKKETIIIKLWLFCMKNTQIIINN